MRWSVFGVCVFIASLAIIIGIFKSRQPSIQLAKSSAIEDAFPVDVSLQNEANDYVEVEADELFRYFHDHTLNAFENTMGFGRTRGGGAHILMGDGVVKFKSDLIENSDSRFGIWGSLGTRTATQNLQSSPLSETSNPASETAIAEAIEPERYPFGFAYLAPSTFDPSFQFALVDIQLIAAKSQRVFVFDETHNHQSILKTESLTREMNAVETKAYAKLAAGQDIVIVRGESELSMLGSLRNERRCMDCHETAQGSLLGAFSYRFRPK